MLGDVHPLFHALLCEMGATMLVLDCESRESAFRTLADILGVSVESLRAELAAIDLEAAYANGVVDGHPDEALWALLTKDLSITPGALDEVRWFHICRVLPSTTFEQGILPLTEALEGVWRTFDEVFAGTPHGANLKTLRKEGVPNFQYELKVGKPYLAGPFGMLVRESAFRAREMGNHDYLRIPEIMEDICDGYSERFGDPILAALQAALVPCIVKFRSTRTSPTYLSSAARYLYDIEQGESLTMWSNHVFDGQNKAVPFEDILGVEFVSVDVAECQKASPTGD